MRSPWYRISTFSIIAASCSTSSSTMSGIPLLAVSESGSSRSGCTGMFCSSSPVCLSRTEQMRPPPATSVTTPRRQLPSDCEEAPRDSVRPRMPACELLRLILR